MVQRNGPTPPAALLTLLFAALLLYMVLPATPGLEQAQQRETRAPRVLLIGLDAADWVMLDRWFEQGELPHLARLARTGLRGDLRTLRPIISPLIWTSIATGQPPDRHGITDFFSVDEGQTTLRPVNRQALLAPTMWDILSSRGRSVAVTAWWASWPADHSLNGRVVTDQVQFAFPGPQPAGEAVPTRSLYHPPALARRLRHCLVPPAALDARAVGTIAPCSAAQLATGTTDQDPAPALLRRVLAATTTYYRMTREMLRDEQPDFTAIYFLGTDTVAHLYSRAAETDPRHSALKRYYRLIDAMVGDLCSQIDPLTLVVLVSDHGFYTGDDRPAGDPADFRNQAASWHRPLGMVLFNAPWIEAGRLDDASVLDIAPTLLWHLLAERFPQLPGRVLLEEQPPQAPAPAALLPFPVPGGHQPTRVPGSGPADRYRDQLRTLGYLEQDEPAALPGARPVIHLADYLQWAGRPEEALARLEQARNHLGSEPRLLFRLAIQQSRAGQTQQALRTLEAALDQGLDPAAGRLVTAVGICCAAGRLEKAATLLEAVAGLTSPQASTARALVAQYRGRLEDALDGYTAALEADPASGYAARQVCRLLDGNSPRLAELCRMVRQAAEQGTGDAPLQLNAGRLLLAAGEPEAAREPLGRAVHLEPDRVEPRLLLGRALYRSGRPAEAFERLSRGLAWHPTEQRLLAGAGAAAVTAGYLTQGTALLERAAQADPANPHLEAALGLARHRAGS